METRQEALAHCKGLILNGEIPEAARKFLTLQVRDASKSIAIKLHKQFQELTKVSNLGMYSSEFYQMLLRRIEYNFLLIVNEEYALEWDESSISEQMSSSNTQKQHIFFENTGFDYPFTEEELWEDTLKMKKARNYKYYLDKFTEGQYSEQAKAEMKKSFGAAADFMNSGFEKSRPNSTESGRDNQNEATSNSVCECAKLSENEMHAIDIVRKNESRIDIMHNFIYKYPNSFFAREVGYRIQKFEIENLVKEKRDKLNKEYKGLALEYQAKRNALQYEVEKLEKLRDNLQTDIYSKTRLLHNPIGNIEEMYAELTKRSINPDVLKALREYRKGRIIRAIKICLFAIPVALLVIKVAWHIYKINN